MSFTSFRNSFLAEAESRLDAVNPATASTTDLLMAGALYKMAAAVAEVDLIGPSALRLLETMTGAQLEAWLQDASNREAFDRILSSSGAMRAIAASSTAMAAVAASSTAMTAVAASSTAMAAVAASSTAMNAVVNSSTAMAAVAASSTAMTAVAASSTAMTALLANSSAWDAVVNSSTAMAAVAASSTAMNAVLANSSAWNAVVNSSTAMTAVAASSTAMNAVVNSSTAMAAVAASSTAMTAVAASSTAMDAVWASNTAADAVLTSATARLAVYESDTALARLQANPAQIARQISIPGRTQYASIELGVFEFVPNGTKVILLRRWYSNSEFDCLNWRRGATDTGFDYGVIQPGGSRGLYGGFADGTVPGTYDDDGAYCNSESDHANFVAACNGLRRDGWANFWYSYPNTLYVRYITV
jgi:hypothetical protein